MLVIKLGGFLVPLKFRDISNIVQRKCIVGIERVGFAEVRIGSAQVVAVYCRDPAQIQLRNLLGQIFLAAEILTQTFGILLSHLGYGTSPPSWVGRNHGGGSGLSRRRGFIVIFE